MPEVGGLGMNLFLAADGLAPAPDNLPVRFGDCVFSPDIDRLFPPDVELDDDHISRVLTWLRNRHPDTFGFTPAPQGSIRTPGEYEPAASLRLVYPGWDDHDEFYGAIIAGAVGHGQVHIHLLQPRDRWMLRRLLNRFGVSTRQVTIHTAPQIESIWIRDYGPQVVFVDGEPMIMDGRYNVDCVHDDAMPSRIAAAEGMPVLRPPLLLEGGNLLSDGRGTCFVTHHLAEVNQISEAELACLLERYFGYGRVVFLEALTGDVIEHVDMFLSVADPGTLLLAEADRLLDPDNHSILEENFARLSALRTARGRPYRIIRVPIPPPLAYNPSNTHPHHVRSYLNLVPFNGVVLVPVFQADLSLEEEALRRIASAFPGREIVPIPADTVAASYGAVHCVTQTSPRF